MCRLINVLELLSSFSFNNSVSLTRHLTIILLKSFFAEIGNIISHYNHLIHLFPLRPLAFGSYAAAKSHFLMEIHFTSRQGNWAPSHVELYGQDMAGV